MKQLLITLLLATTTGGYAQKFLSDNEITEQVFGTEKLYKLEKTGEPLDGAYKVALGEGAYYEVTFENGRMNSSYKSYSPQGNLMAEKNFKKGVLDGKSIFYNDEGKEKELRTYKEGKLEGISKEYTSDGKLRTELSYKAGKPNGEWKYYDSEGKPRKIENYKDGKLHGKQWQKMSGNRGDYTATEYYDNDKPTGKWQEIWENGLPLSEREYKDKGTYTQREFYRNGKIRISSSTALEKNIMMQAYSFAKIPTMKISLPTENISSTITESLRKNTTIRMTEKTENI